MDNMKIYELARKVPDEAKKPIMAGRLKGMTDINPMYRIKRLTELFGPCGLGWWYEITKKEIVDDELTKQRAAFVDILLYYVDPDTGNTSVGIPGTGGAAFVSQERSGPYMSDECFKMALTDAISVAAKAIGIAADVYWDKDRTKYTAPEYDEPARDVPRRGSTEAAQAVGQQKLERMNAQLAGNEKPPTCDSCGKVITGWVDATGKRYTASALIKRAQEKYNGCYCAECMTRIAANSKKEA